MNENNTNNFFLHSRGNNWFHFRKYPNMIMESFSVTYCHDGTVCMTGDMGCLVWQREYFPTRMDYGFPFENTGIEYFAEKIVRASEGQRIEDWTQERAKKDITEFLVDLHSNETGYNKDIEFLEDLLESIDSFESNGEYGYIQMLEVFNNRNHNIESETFCKFGRGYSDNFRMKFELLQSVSKLIIYSLARTGNRP